VAYDHSPIQEIANEARSIPTEWINARGNDIMPELIEYLTPLIQGEVAVSYENGLPSYMNVSHLSRNH
jgi:6-phosphofructokinase 1